MSTIDPTGADDTTAGGPDDTTAGGRGDTTAGGRGDTTAGGRGDSPAGASGSTPAGDIPAGASGATSARPSGDETPAAVAAATQVCDAAGDDAPHGAHTAGRGVRPARHWLWVLLALVVQVGLVAVAVAPQLSARTLGTDYRLRVAPIDPIDPFRGAYVALSYPDLPQGTGASTGRLPQDRTIYVPLQPRDTDAGRVWAGGKPTPTRPADGPYLTCRDDYQAVKCGIDSWFVPQDEAARLETAVRGGHAVAVVRIDDRGNAAIVDLVTPEGVTR